MSQAIKRAIVMTAEYYGRQISEPVLEMYCEDLADLDPQLVCAGYQQYRRNPANRIFPLPAQIRELVNPEEFVSAEVKARETAARICGAVTTFGWNNALSAERYIGPEGWDAVGRSGGWSYICENLGTRISVTTFQAQIRDQLEGSFKYGSAAIENAIGAGSSERRKGELTGMADILSLLARPDDEEPGAA